MTWAAAPDSRRAVSADLTAYLLLHWHSYHEQFCVKVGWLLRAAYDDIGACFNAVEPPRRGDYLRQRVEKLK